MQVCFVYMDRDLIARTVFFVVDVFEDGKVRGVARQCDETVVESLTDSASGFVSVGAVAVAAVFRRCEDLRKEVGDFIFVIVDSAETFDSGGVDYVASAG